MDPSLCILTSYQAGVVVAVVARPCDRSLDSSVKGEGDPFSAALPSCPFMIGPAPMSTEFTFLFLIFLFFLTDHREEHASRVQVIILPYIYISLLIGVYIMSYLFVFIGAMEFLVRVPFPLRRFRTTYIYLIYSYLSFCVLLWDEKKQVRVSCVRAGRPCRLSAR